MKLQDKNLYYIGGIVRDEILGKESFDTDLTYVGDAIEFAKSIENAEIIRINEPFGTVKIMLEGEEIDIASTRKEIYPQKGRLPEIEEIGCSLKDDVLRRDFTINAMAKSTLTGEITDYTSGLQDIKTKTLRVLHKDSFIDDPTRIVRGLKFSVRFGFELSPETLALQKEYLDNINYDMSYKRLQKELKETFSLNSQEAFEKFVEQKIYKLVTPKDFDLPKINFEKLINRYKPKCPWIIYAGQIPDIEILPLTKAEKKIVEDFKSIIGKSFSTDAEIYENFKDLYLESIIMFASIDEKAVLHYLNKLRYIKTSLTGADLQTLGIKPSKKYQECFKYVVLKIFQNPQADKSQQITWAKEFFEG